MVGSSFLDISFPIPSNDDGPMSMVMAAL